MEVDHLEFSTTHGVSPTRNKVGTGIDKGYGTVLDYGMASSLLEHTLLSAHDPETGRYDAKRLAAALAITNTEMAEML